MVAVVVMAVRMILAVVIGGCRITSENVGGDYGGGNVSDTDGK